MEFSSDKKDLEYLERAREVALDSTCFRAKCGAIIVNEDEIIGKGFNSPPKNLENQRRCLNNKENYDKKITDKTCCVHAEQRAIIDALKKNPERLLGSKLYFIRLNKDETAKFAGNPYCTICSKMALDVGILKWILLHEKGVCIYDAEEYNNLSFNFNKHH